MHKTCTGTKKTHVLKFKVHQTCTGTKKTNVLNFKVHKTCTGTKKNKKNKNFTIYLGRGDYPSKVFVFFCFFCPCAGLAHFEVQNFCFFVPVQVWCTLKFKTLIFFVPVQVLDRALDFKVHQTCTGTKKTQVLNFKLHQTCTGTKKTKVLNFKVHQTCTGTKKNKKNKNFTIYLGRGDYPSKVFVFFCFFCPCAGLVHFEVQNFCFFCPCAGLVHFEVHHFDFFCPCAGLVHFEVQNPMHLFICILILLLLLADILDAYCIFCFPCSFLKGQVHFSCKGFTI